MRVLLSEFTFMFAKAKLQRLDKKRVPLENSCMQDCDGYRAKDETMAPTAHLVPDRIIIRDLSLLVLTRPIQSILGVNPSREL